MHRGSLDPVERYVAQLGPGHYLVASIDILGGAYEAARDIVAAAGRGGVKHEIFLADPGAVSVGGLVVADRAVLVIGETDSFSISSAWVHAQRLGCQVQRGEKRSQVSSVGGRGGTGDGPERSILDLYGEEQPD